MAPRLPYVDGIVASLLRDALPGVTVETQYNNGIFRTPYVWVEVVGGTPLDPDLAVRAILDVRCFTGPDKRDGAELAEDVRRALWDGRHAETPDGYLVHIATEIGPRQIPEPAAPADVVRYDATYRVIARKRGDNGSN